MATTQQEQLQRSLQLAVTAHKAHDLATALKHYAEVLAINPSLPAIHNNMAAVSLAQGVVHWAPRKQSGLTKHLVETLSTCPVLATNQRRQTFANIC